MSVELADDGLDYGGPGGDVSSAHRHHGKNWEQHGTSSTNTT